MPVSDSGRSRHSVGWLLVGITAVAALPRLLALFDAFWLDEIWSLRLAAQVGSAWEIVTGLHHDNNHYLNTLWLRALGSEAPWPLYRLPAFGAGVATVYLAGSSELGEGKRPAVLAAVLFGIAYPLLHYSSEARGYAPAVFLALASFVLLRKHHRESDARSGVLFAITASLAFLAHLTFVTVYLPMLAWSLRLTFSRRQSGRRAFGVLVPHVAPMAVLYALVMVDVQYVVRGGSSGLPPLVGWLRAGALMVGIPTAGALGVMLGGGFLVALLAGLRRHAQTSPHVDVFFVLALLFPVALLLVLGGGYGPPRYFLVSLAFATLLVSRGLGAMLERGGAPRAFAGVLLLVAVVGNGWRITRFLEDGRGSYREAVTYLVAHTSGDTIRVESDHPFRTAMVLDYYRRFAPAHARLEYEREGTRGPGSPEWYFLHELSSDFRPPSELRPREGIDPPYTLQAVFPKYGLSGWHWALYRRPDA